MGTAQQAQRPSLLPVPYQGKQQAFPGQENALQVVPPAQDIGASNESVVYLPPMYTKPRAIIPRYRVISGFLSVLIVTVLLCTGVSYYVQASGKLDALRQMYGVALPPSLQPAPTAQLAVPPDTVDKGPVYAIIPSATTTARLDANHLPVDTERAFQANQTFYLTYSVLAPKTAGTVSIKWYTNKLFYRQVQSNSIPAGGTYNGYTPMNYVEPAEGMVELYWNNQLAQRLYFVVQGA